MNGQRLERAVVKAATLIKKLSFMKDATSLSKLRKGGIWYYNEEEGAKIGVDKFEDVC